MTILPAVALLRHTIGVLLWDDSYSEIIHNICRVWHRFYVDQANALELFRYNLGRLRKLHQNISDARISKLHTSTFNCDQTNSHVFFFIYKMNSSTKWRASAKIIILCKTTITTVNYPNILSHKIHLALFNYLPRFGGNIWFSIAHVIRRTNILPFRRFSKSSTDQPREKLVTVVSADINNVHARGRPSTIWWVIVSGRRSTASAARCRLRSPRLPTKARKRSAKTTSSRCRGPQRYIADCRPG